MKKSHWIVLIIVLAIVLGITIGVYFSEEPRRTDQGNAPNTTKLSQINRKVKELEERIQHEVAELKLTSEMEIGLNKIVDRISFGLGVAVIGLFAFIVSILHHLGLDLINAILSTAGLASIVFPIISIVLWRNVELSGLILTSRRWVKSWLDNKYGHDPDDIIKLNVEIQNKQSQLKELGSNLEI